MKTERRGYGEKVKLGRWNEQDLDRMLAAAAEIPATGKRIAFLSAQFLGVAYRESTLIGDTNAREILVINLEALDCFTYLDYVEAMRLSDSFASFKEMVRRVRYRNGDVAYATRNHFFTDWIERNSLVKDVTSSVGGTNAREIHKRLNDHGEGKYLVDGIEPVQRVITFIPGKAVDNEVIRQLRTGDYIGIYSREKGLDVSHVGIVIKRNLTSYFRHASSAESQRKVIDQDFRTYTVSKPGIVILRPTK
jgi:hypothetical protein